MLQIFEIYLYMCGIIISILILAGLIGLTLNAIAYAYESAMGFGTFKEILREYNNKKHTKKVEKTDFNKNITKM